MGFSIPILKAITHRKIQICIYPIKKK